MSRKAVSARMLLALIVAGLALPVAICVVLALASLLDAMRDFAGAAVLRYVALAGGVVWVVVLVGLIFVEAIQMLGRSDDAEP